MTTRTWKQRLSALILALALTFDVAAQGLVCFADTGETVPETTVATEPTVPETTIPETTVPETTIPETTAPVEPVSEEPTVPETTVPETTVPETTVPETTVPETTASETTAPETTVPETTVPETTVPETTVPETTVPEETVPETTVPETTVPEETEPEETEPVMMAPAPEEDTLYTRMLAAETLQAMHDTMMATPSEMFSMTAEELTALRTHADELYAALETPTTDDEDYYVLVTETVDMLQGELEPEGEPEVLDLPAGYIYFDLSQGNVTITQDTYSGKLNGEEVTGTHSNTNQYYIFQGDGTSSYTTLPSYANVTYNGTDWGDYVTNHPSKSTAGDDSVDEVIVAWDNAEKGTRVATPNRVTVKTTQSNTQFNITIDNLWSSLDGASFYIESNGTAIPDNKYGTHTNCATNVAVNLNVKGDNRFGRLHCATNDGQNNNYNSDTTHSNIINISGDTDATLTLANVNENSSKAHTSALIGGTDGHDHSFKMTFDKITVYAGGGRLDFGTAIGGGGNGPGRVTINGGRITAVNSATGTAIGGGCGTTGPGGYGNVTITGGSVYAYNYTPHYTSEDSDEYTDAIPTAIGGGSSGTQVGGTGIVKITGGYVYAYSEVGNAIGGGGGGNGTTSEDGTGAFAHTYGGTADITITGDAEVDAISGTGCAIGGGPGGGRRYKIYVDNNEGKLPNATTGDGDKNVPVNGDGGTAKLTISGNPTIRSGSIGGGSPLDQNRTYGATVGAAVVNISGGTTHGQVVMDGVIKNVPAEIKGLTNGEDSSFTMSGGLIDNTSIGAAYHFVEENGGAVYINSGTATMSGGIIQDASAPLGGAIYLKGGNFTMSGSALIQNCNATAKADVTDSSLGGAVYVEGGNVAINGGRIENCQAKNGGAAYVTGGSFNMTGGTINSNTATNEGGAAYVTGGNVIIGTKNCSNTSCLTVSNNTAINGGAFAVAGATPILYCGTVIGNVASNHGGAVYVSGEGGFLMYNGVIDGGVDVDSNPKNNAKLGGGIYLSGGDFEMHNGAIQGNTATTDGGGFYISGGNFTMHNGSIQDNSAPNGNGGGGAVNGGNFTMKNGFIGDETIGTVDEQTVILPSNTAKNGGGIYVAGGTANVEGGTIQYNKATNGGGAYVTASGSISGALNLSGDGSFVGNTATVDGGGFYVSGGNFTMNNGTIHSNTATVNGGGGVVQGGEFLMHNGTIGGRAVDGEVVTLLSNSAQNGGGVYVSGGNFRMNDGSVVGNIANTNGGGINVADGNVTIVYGVVDYNQATANGGGVMVTSSKAAVSVTMLSGSLSNNSAYNGGGMAVDGNNQAINIEIGCLMDHFTGENHTLKLDFAYAGDDYNQYASHKHSSCPVVAGNICEDIGGGFYLASPKSTLNFYCIRESGNKSTSGQTNCWGMDVEGGKVNIGDEVYHNCNTNATDIANRGYVQMGSTILVTGGDVNIYGDMENPFFAKNITVDIQLGTDGKALGSYTDHRRDEHQAPSYKVHYVENFPESEDVRTGVYIAKQYTNDEAKKVTIDGAMFYQEGYTIVGWFIDEEGTKAEYKVGTTYDLTYVDDPESNEDKPFEGSVAPPLYKDSNGDDQSSIGITTSNCTTCGNEKTDSYLLKLYAKWVLNGYRILFEPGISDGSYTGTMEPQTFTYHEEKALSENQFVYPGWKFSGWKDKDDPSKTYTDKQPVSKLAPKNGQDITLVAQWVKCDHGEAAAWEYIPNGNVITGRCSCGYEETLTLEASNTVYDGKSHPATLTISDPAGYCPGWIERIVDAEGTVKVTAKALTPGYPEEKIQKAQNNTLVPPLVDGEPVYAGKYTAQITIEDVTASIAYEITKAEHPKNPTEKPGYTVDTTDSTKVNVVGISETGAVDYPINASNLSEKSQTPAEYRLVYYDTTSQTWNPGSDAWTDDKNWPDMKAEVLQLQTQTEWKNYRVEARFAETYNYKASKSVQSNGTYFFSGGVEVQIICDEHISATFQDSGTAQQITSAKLDMIVEPGYFLVNNQFEITVDITKIPTSGASSSIKESVDPVPANDGKATFDMSKITISTESGTKTVVTIRIGQAQSKASVTAVTKERKLYSNVVDEDAAVSISNDSAFTAYFQVGSYNTTVLHKEAEQQEETATHVYMSPVLNFRTVGENLQTVTLPENTTILLMDMSGGTKTYWHYMVGTGGVSTVALTDFQKMGSTSNETHPDAQENQATLEYQFIVDFSQCNAYPAGSFEMVLSVAKKTVFGDDKGYAYIPAPSAAVTVNLASTEFALEETGTGVLSKKLQMSYTPGHNAASRWEGRGSALKLTFQPEQDGTNPLPEDVYIKAVSGNTTVAVFPGKTDGEFLVPLSKLTEGNKDVSLSLVSEKFPVEQKDYQFAVEWLVSDSAASKAPLRGDSVVREISRENSTDKSCKITFSKPLDTNAALKILDGKRIITIGEPFAIEIQSAGLTDALEITAIPEIKQQNGEYIGFGVTYDMPTGNQGSLTVDRLQGPGNYRVKITIMQSGGFGIVLDDIFYYFIAEAPVATPTE